MSSTAPGDQEAGWLGQAPGRQVWALLGTDLLDRHAFSHVIILMVRCRPAQNPADTSRWDEGPDAALEMRLEPEVGREQLSHFVSTAIDLSRPRLLDADTRSDG
ncbi:hypothetical protein AB0I39_06935 [Kitasatospora purpeofusca]|uniref:hypothetical protein n=1 Tax=Kitasatospora purpeofusca TaxID=67352 RepID=UPI00340F8BB8